MIARPDAVSYTLPLQYFLDFVYSLRARDYERLHNSVSDVQGYVVGTRQVIAKVDGVWRNSSELVETKAHNYEHGWQAAVAWSVESMFTDIIGIPCKLKETLGKGRNNFRFSVEFEGGFVAFGGNNRVLDSSGAFVEVPERMQLFLTGEYCQGLSDDHWRRLYEWSTGVDGLKLTRVDLCVDDLQGKFDIAHALDQYQAGAFATSKGRPPKGRHVKALGENTEGETVYVGSRTSGKMIRIYEKGKQLGDAGSPWVRWEVELLAKDRVIPLDSIVNCDEYFGGAYPACLPVLDHYRGDMCEAWAIRTGKEKARISFAHLQNHCRRSYGPLIEFMVEKMQMTAEGVISALRGGQDSRPARLSVSALDAFCTSLVDLDTGELKIPE